MKYKNLQDFPNLEGSYSIVVFLFDIVFFLNECLRICEIFIIRKFVSIRYSLDAANFSDTELIQYRSPVGSGPSSKTCPKWASHRLQRISVRIIP